MTDRLWVWSDLHQEWPENAWDPAAHAPPGGFDVAVVAGDVHMPLTRALDWLAERLPGVPAVYVPGNHDYWWDRGEDRYTLADQMSRGRDAAARHGIHLLMDDAVTLGGTRYLGGTLWTDFRHGSTSLTQAMRSAQGRNGMVDYRRIRTGPSSRHRIEPVDVLALHRRARVFVEATLSIPHDGPTGVVTHHAPHPDSLPDPHADLRWCYASNLRDLIHARGPDLWIHGHVHHAADYRVGPTRVVAAWPNSRLPSHGDMRAWPGRIRGRATSPPRTRLGMAACVLARRTGHFDLSGDASSIFGFVARSGARAYPTAHRIMAVRQPTLPIYMRDLASSADQAALAAWYEPAVVERRNRSWAWGDGDDLIEMHQHILTLHPRTGDGSFVLSNKRGAYTEASHRARVPLQPSDVRGQQFVSMNRFQRRRLGAMLASVGHIWLEFDPYGEDAQGRPLPYRGMALDALMALILAAILEAGLPAPSYWTDSGRGLHAVWLCEALPAKAAPKLQKIMDALYGPVLNDDGSVPARGFEDPDRDAQEARLAPMWRVFRDAGLDQGTQDSSRVLRIWGSYNVKAGKRCTRLWPSQIEDIQRCTVDAVGDAVLPITREELRRRLAERAANPVEPTAPAKAERPRRTRSATAYAGKMGVWERKLSDLMRLREHRGRIAVGQRHMWVFLTANAYAQAKGDHPETWAEMLAPLAGLTVASALDCLKSLGRRQKRHEAGETVEHDGVVWTPLFHYSGAKMADRLGVTEAEADAAGLNLVRPGLGKAIPPIQRKAEKRVRDGAIPRADRADAKLRAGRQGLALRAEGKTAEEAIEAIRATTGRGRTWAIEAMKAAAASPVEDVAETVAPAPSQAPATVRKSGLERVRFSGRYIGGYAPAPASTPSAPAVPAPIATPQPYAEPIVTRVSDISTRLLVAPGVEYLVVDDPKDRFLGRWVLRFVDGQHADATLPAHLEPYLPVRRRRAPRPVRSTSRRRPVANAREPFRSGVTTAEEYLRLTRGF